MSLYQVNKILYLLEVDRCFLAQMKANPAAAICGMELSEEERTALVTGNIEKLYLMGANMFILDSVARHHLYGIDRQNYLERIRSAASQSDKASSLPKS
jgi:hypothetical protein